eukprot:12337922-Prorocentrum_lima.AAC.1
MNERIPEVGKNDGPQGNQDFCLMSECIPAVVKAMWVETGAAKLFSANLVADNNAEMLARGRYCLGRFGPMA